jgi:zinc transport system substrate-binding protein
MRNVVSQGITIALIALLLFFLPVKAQAAQKRTPKVITTLFVLYDFCRQLGQDQIELKMLLEPGVEAHSFEPRPRDIVTISEADLFVYAGDVMEPWAKSLLKGVTNKNLQVVDASKGILLSGGDPHIWLDLSNARVMAETIVTALISRCPEKKDFFLARLRDYQQQLTQLDGRFASVLAGCRLRTFIYAGHFTFGYFARRYQLQHISPYKGFSPDAEPAPRALAELINKTREMGIRTIYYEELIDPKIARVIAEETGAQLLMLASGHNVSRDDFKRGVTFISIMNDNLEKLTAGLECR